MMYTKPQLLGYAAIAAIQETGGKNEETLESGSKTDPAYEADE
jgi:hypothetical protein